MSKSRGHRFPGAAAWARAWSGSLLCGGLLLGARGVVSGQEIQLGDRPAETSPARRQHVQLETDAVQAKAGRPDWVELRFRVNPGLHINSHAPHDELLVPTSLEVEGGGQVKVVGQEYPAGVPLRLDVGAGEVLSTYQGEFRVRLQLVAAKGDAVLEGVLRYQACEARSCFPPKSLPVRVVVAAR